MKYRLSFRVPPAAKAVIRHFDGTEFSYTKVAGSPTRASIEVAAAHERQAYVIGGSIAKRNGWSLSGQPLKVGA